MRKARVSREALQLIKRIDGGRKYADNYLAYLESTSVEEFRRMTSPGKITQEDIDAVDWEKLSQQLLGQGE